MRRRPTPVPGRAAWCKCRSATVAAGRARRGPGRRGTGRRRRRGRVTRGAARPARGAPGSRPGAPGLSREAVERRDGTFGGEISSGGARPLHEIGGGWRRANGGRPRSRRRRWRGADGSRTAPEVPMAMKSAPRRPLLAPRARAGRRRGGGGRGEPCGSRRRGWTRPPMPEGLVRRDEGDGAPSRAVATARPGPFHLIGRVRSSLRGRRGSSGPRSRRAPSSPLRTGGPGIRNRRCIGLRKEHPHRSIAAASRRSPASPPERSAAVRARAAEIPSHGRRGSGRWVRASSWRVRRPADVPGV